MNVGLIGADDSLVPDFSWDILFHHQLSSPVFDIQAALISWYFSIFSSSVETVYTVYDLIKGQYINKVIKLMR